MVLEAVKLQKSLLRRVLVPKRSPIITLRLNSESMNKFAIADQQQQVSSHQKFKSFQQTPKADPVEVSSVVYSRILLEIFENQHCNRGKGELALKNHALSMEAVKLQNNLAKSFGYPEVYPLGASLGFFQDIN